MERRDLKLQKPRLVRLKKPFGSCSFILYTEPTDLTPWQDLWIKATFGLDIFGASVSWELTSLLPSDALLCQVILLEHEIPHQSFSGKVLACLPPEDWAITPENSAARKDLRHLAVVSIDPPGCKDIDDALHARPLENGNIEVSWMEDDSSR